MSVKFTAILVVLQLYGLYSFCQNPAIMPTYTQRDKLIKYVDSKINRFHAKADWYSTKALRKIILQEKKMKQIMAKKDSSLAARIFTYSIDSLQRLQQVIAAEPATVNRVLSKNYFGYTDSLKQVLRFLDQLSVNSVNDRLLASIRKIELLDVKLAKIEEAKRFIAERKKFLKNYFKNSAEFAKHLKKLNKEAYYYYSQIEQYKSALNESGKIEQIVVKALLKIPEFNSFFEANSSLAAIFAPSGFSLPMTSATTPISGIPSRFAVQQIIKNTFVSSTSVTQFLNQQISGSANVINSIKAKVNEFDGMNKDEIPDYKVNSLRTKSFWQRLEYCANLQFSKAINFLPATSDVALQIGYRLTRKSSIGMGAIYKFGIGDGWNNIRLTHEGIGFRSYADYRIAGNFYVQGGGEMTYLAAFKNIEELKNFNAWKASALFGLSKKYQVSKKLKGNFQILFDVLHKVNMPETRPFVFRVGYNF
jgi:hypothetical protein